jgi:SNF2 family DNA or RNA helicase
MMPWRQDVASVIPHAREFQFQGNRMLMVPNGQTEARVCRNLGVPVPAPILTRYDWRGSKPWDIQRTTAAMLTEQSRAYVLNTMGTGKTRSVLYAIDYLMLSGAVTGPALVTAPLSTLTPVWEAEAFRVLPQRRVRVLHGTREKRLKLLREKADIYVINHHGLMLLKKELICKGFSIFCIDELAVLRNKQTDLWRAAFAIEQSPSVAKGYAWGLTGSPTPHSPTDAWAQIKLLTPSNTTRTFGQFSDQTMRRITQFKFEAREDANAVVHRAMQPAVRFTIQDVMELPPTVYLDKIIKLEPQALSAYKMLFGKARMNTGDGRSITAVNEGVLHNKLLQVACGYIYTDTSTIYELPHQSRLDALLETVEEADGKFIVFCPYTHALNGVAGFLRGKNYNIATISGTTSRGQRDRTFTSFQDDPVAIQGIVAHPGTMAHGLTLTAADTIIWYGPIQSLETYDQANHRIIRPSQTKKTRIVHLFGTGVERVTYARLKARAKMQGALLDLFHKQDIEF